LSLTLSMATCAGVTLVAFVATQFIPANAASGVSAASPDGSNVSVELHTDVQPTGAGQALALLDLSIDLTNSVSGLPVDDLVPNHDALMHVFIVSADRGFFQHMYPARTAPGHYVAAFTPDRSGDYTAYVEVLRPTDSAPEVFSYSYARSLSVTGNASGIQRGMGGVSVAMSKSPTNILTAEPAVLTFTFSASGRAIPLARFLDGTADVVIVKSDGAAFGHVQASDVTGISVPMTTPAQAALGPTVYFSYTFPAAGNYTLWAEAKRADSGVVITTSKSIDVGPAMPNS